MGVAISKSVNGRTFVHIYTYETGVWHPHTSRHQYTITKVGMAHEHHTSTSIPHISGQTQMIFKAGLIQMTQFSFNAAPPKYVWQRL